MANGDVLASAVTSASYNILFQFAFRLLTFALNAFTVHYISRDLLGVVNVRLTLLYSTILFLSREAFRKACLSRTEKHQWPQFVNLAWCTVPLGVLWACVWGFVWIFFLDRPDPAIVQHYDIGVVVFALATIVELMSEPLVILSQVLLFVRLKVVIEGIAQALRCVLIVCLLLIQPCLEIWIFALGQITLSFITTALYYLYFIQYAGKSSEDFPFTCTRDFFPKVTQPMFVKDLRRLTWSFFKQSFLKQILTEGERYVMTFLSVITFADQGMYDVINNLGSLAARFIFFPIEDSAFLLFSQSLSRGKTARNEDKYSLYLTTRILECLLKLVSMLGLLAVVFGLSYSRLALQLYGGVKLSSGSGPMLLQCYSCYVLLLAINGVSESFVFATMHKEQVDRYNALMVVLSALLLCSSYFLARYMGSIGFIIANCGNMAARIAHSFLYLRTYQAGSGHRPWRSALPAVPVLGCLLVSAVCTAASEHWTSTSAGFFAPLLHIVIGALCLSVTLAAVWFSEKDMIAFVLDQYYKRRSKLCVKLADATVKEKLT